MNQALGRRQSMLAVLGLFLASLDQTVVSTAMPRVIADLNGFALYPWVTTAYVLAETVVLPIVGKLGDLYGRKWLTIIGVAIFVSSSAFCGQARNMPWLIVGRGMQGLGGGMLFSSVLTLVADIFPDPRDRARYQGMLFSVFGLSSVVGPVLGGWITDTLGWRWVFYVNLPLGLIALAILPRVPPQRPRQRGARIDYLGAVVITVSVVALLLALEWAGAGSGWASARVLGGLVIAALAFAVFVPIERRAAEPIIPFALFRNRTISATSALLFLLGIGMFGLTLYVPLYLQGVLGQSASASGMVMIPMVITMTVMGMVIGQVLARVGNVRHYLVAGTGVPAPALTALNSPNALISDAALRELARLLAQVPSGTQLMQGLLLAARVALSDAIRQGFVFTLVATMLAFGCCFLMGTLRLDERMAGSPLPDEGARAPQPERRDRGQRKVGMAEEQITVATMRAVTLSREYGSGSGELAGRMALG